MSWQDYFTCAIKTSVTEFDEFFFQVSSPFSSVPSSEKYYSFYFAVILRAICFMYVNIKLLYSECD